MPASDTDISKLMSLVLRHDPRMLGITLDAQGWTDYAGLSGKLCARLGVTDDDIRRVIAENSKKRFTLEGGRIRAAQGHSVAVSLGLPKAVPPARLYHGTTAAAWSLIAAAGLKPMGRSHVHLSPDVETAEVVARRRKGPHVILAVDTAAMVGAGYAFLVADNGVWLTAEVPPQFLSPVTETAR